MRKKTILIVEDEPVIAADLQEQLIRAGYEVPEPLDEAPLVLEYLKLHRVDVVLLDIQIFGDLDGIDLGHEIKDQYAIPIIYLTSNMDQKTFAKAKLTEPFAFLSKPFRISDIQHSIELAIASVEENSGDSMEILGDRIFIKSQNTLTKVLFSDVLYLEADGAYTKIYTQDHQYMVSQTLKNVTDKTNQEGLLRVHRSYVVNVRQIDQLTDNYLLIGQHKVPVGRVYKQKLLQSFKMI